MTLHIRSVPGSIAAGIVAAQLLAGETVSFREPGLRTFDLDDTHAPGAGDVGARDQTTGRRVEFTHRVVVQSAPGQDADALALTEGLVLEWRVDDCTSVYRATDASHAVHAAARLSLRGGVAAAMPGLRRGNAARHYAWATAPNDPYFPQQWSLDSTGSGFGQPPVESDLNFRGAWALTRGAGITIAVFDDGIDARHPDLKTPYVPGLAHNFFTEAEDGSHSMSWQYHGTSVAGLAAAAGDNGIGISGAAPAANITSWVIFDANDSLPETTRLAAAFMRAPDVVAVQNHSWGNADFDFLEPSTVERLAISNAVFHGRSGRGTVMVRSAGNTRIRNFFRRQGAGDANLDGFANEPGAITVGSVRRNGRVASYSTPGACVLLAAPGGETSEGSQLFTLDPVGDSGANTIAGAGIELANYLYGNHATVGTSFSAPLISGLAALILSVNPDLQLTDCQRILALSAHHLDIVDPDLATNAAGLRISHNVGFGIPDAGRAVRLAATFHRSPVRRTHGITNSEVGPIPDDGLRVRILGVDAPGVPASVPASGGTGIHPDRPTAALGLVDMGQATAPLTNELHNAAALGFRRPNDFSQKIAFAADAGAEFVVLVNTDLGNDRLLMLLTDFAPIPAVLVGGTDGALLQSLVATNPAARFRLGLDSATRVFSVSNSLSLDWVQVRLRIKHPRMGDLRITLRSPAGTLSVLQRAGTQTTSQLEEWLYSSQRHRFEGSAGDWSLAVTDEAGGSTGTLNFAELILTGIPITDRDADGLDDDWERLHFGDLSAAADGDPDGDGISNAVEAYLGTDPTVSDRPLIVGLDADRDRWRISFPGVAGPRHQVQQSQNPAGPWEVLGDSSHAGDEGVWFVPAGPDREFFRIRHLP